MIFFFFLISFSFLSRAEAGALAQQYLERGLLVPDHVITRVMMAELEKRREQHWLLDGEPRGGIPAPLGRSSVPHGLAAPGEREAGRGRWEERQELSCWQGRVPLASARACPAEPLARGREREGQGEELGVPQSRAGLETGQEKLLPSFTCVSVQQLLDPSPKAT